jgi:hypothetical protein
LSFLKIAASKLFAVDLTTRTVSLFVFTVLCGEGPSHTLIYDLQYRLRCRECGRKSGLRDIRGSSEPTAANRRAGKGRGHCGTYLRLSTAELKLIGYTQRIRQFAKVYL